MDYETRNRIANLERTLEDERRFLSARPDDRLQRNRVKRLEQKLENEMRQVDVFDRDEGTGGA